MDIENNQLHDGKNEPSLENEKTEESDQIRETESTSLNDPMNWSIKKKQFIVFIISTAGSIIPLSSTIFFPAIIKIGVDLNTSQAFGGSAAQSIGAGTISDIFIHTERGRAYGWFNLGNIIGVVIGPTIGGYITQYLGWRFIFVFLSIYGSATLIIIYFALPETFRHTQLSLTTTPLPKKRFNPFLSLGLLRYPNLSLPILYMSIIFSVIYVQNTLVPITFSTKYNLSPSNVGLVFLATSIGYSLGSIASGSYSDFLLAKNREKYGSICPEMRINSIWLGSVLVPISLLAYGLFIVKNVHIALPISSLFFFAFGSLLVFNGSSTYLIDAFPGRSASATAVNNCFKSIAASIMSFISAPLENALGTGLLYTLLTVFIISGTSCMVIVYFKGKKWREHFQK
ncbi:31271_t:CDS:2 [Gigaspora margarita]|uniref:31271_t:CDS:1 n=1 Tax=Gigaspora margarita TaxID=4874 RepID=A0ABN7VRX5_GIGMA|nr:31271_t:CDS:2 [Gigaspora margarita]